MKTGIERIAAERQRQIDVEGWTPEHDDEHSDGSLALAAACYATSDIYKPVITPGGKTLFADPWPWSSEWDKRPVDGTAPRYRIRALEKAGALIAAEIDRLARQTEETQTNE